MCGLCSAWVEPLIRRGGDLAVGRERVNRFFQSISSHDEKHFAHIWTNNNHPTGLLRFHSGGHCLSDEISADWAIVVHRQRVATR